MNTNAGFTLVEFLLFIILVLVIAWLATLEWRFLQTTRTLRTLFAGRGGIDLEQMLRDYAQRMDRSDQTVTTLAARTVQLEQKAPLNLQHLGVVRYNPFADKGSDQSFAVALLDDHADGVVFNGLHSRNDTRVYAKPVVGGNSTYLLSAEEKEAINRAMSKR